MESQNQKQANKQTIINQKIVNKSGIIEDDEDSSQWSLASLQDLKAMNLKDMAEDQEPHQVSHKEKQPIEVKFPEKPTVLANAALHEVGKVIFIVGQLLILQSAGHSFVVDLDNWLCNEQKQLIGFVIDVFGKIQNPYYAIRPQQISNINAYLLQSLYYIEGSSKILKDQDIKSMKSKSVLQQEDQQLDNSSDEQVKLIEKDIQQQIYEHKPQHVNYVQRKNNHKTHNDNRRPEIRERTRQQMRDYRNQSRQRQQHNKKYLQNIYSNHYHQMMNFYNPNPNSNMPYSNPNNRSNDYVSHQNISRFGSTNSPNQFFGQAFPVNYQNTNPFNNQINSQNNVQINNPMVNHHFNPMPFHPTNPSPQSSQQQRQTTNYNPFSTYTTYGENPFIAKKQ